jgi:hypothetical protein
MASGGSIRSSDIGIGRAAVLAATILTLGACSAPEYSSPAWSGRVVDLETGAPIEGAVVVVRWPVETFHADLGGWLVIDEAVTDSDGMFRFRAWGPLRTPDHRGSRTRLSPNVPSIDVFKSRYKIAVSTADSDMSYMDDRSYIGPAVRKVYADEKIFGLQKFRGTDTQYGKYLDASLSLGGPLCNYQLIPQMYAAVVMEDRRLASETGHGIPHTSIRELEREDERYKCQPNFRDAIKKYLD